MGLEISDCYVALVQQRHYYYCLAAEIFVEIHLTSKKEHINRDYFYIFNVSAIFGDVF